MSDPYRDSALEVPAEAPRDEGIVGDVIAQFADPKAFYRELVQNSIDAGSPTVEIKLEYDEGAQRMHVIVRDRGEGMTRQIVENQLLVLFRSTKEQDKTKIGKFGIGFVSVLAPSPEVVAVNTARDGKRIAMHLYRDLSYELFDAGPATQNGTTVELEIALKPDDVAAFVRDSEMSLVRWCRHASVPIELAVRVPGDTSTRRIDRPIGIDKALVEVRRSTDDDQLSVVVAINKDATPYVGFFNHGLMLYETLNPMLGRIAVKIQDARLGHTISRDDVRRDEHFRRALRFAEEVAGGDLVRAAAAQLYAAADAHDLDRHRELMIAIGTSGVELARSDMHVPIVEPINGKQSIAASELAQPVWTASASSQLTTALASEGTPVVLAKYPGEVATLLGMNACEVEAELTSISPIETTDSDDALLALLTEMLDAAHRAPAAIVLANLTGARADHVAIAGKHADIVHVVDRDEAARDPFALLRKRVLVLSVDHFQVRAARTGDPVVAASLLARAVLLQHRLLTFNRSSKLADHALARVGVDK